MTEGPGSRREKPHVFFSHSGRPEDVDLNIFLWRAVADECQLLVDQYKDKEPLPWYVNRIEEYIRRSDLFLAALTHREPRTAEPAAKRDGDEGIRCSPYSLFEVRCAERARKPRLVFYEKGTRFRRLHRREDPLVQYVRFERNVVLHQGGAGEREKIGAWLRSVRGLAASRVESDRAVILLPASLPDREEILESIRDALDEADYERVDVIDDVSTDAEVLSALADCSLLVADLSRPDLFEVYAMAHALFIPSIRVLRTEAPPEEKDLPWLLRGHPQGYAKDLVTFVDPGELTEKIAARAKAMIDMRSPIDSFEGGRQFFSRNRRHSVFLSHNLKGADRQVIDAIVGKLEEAAVKFYEYEHCQGSGDNWPERMTEELAAATHVVAVMGPGYENSRACLEELDSLLKRGDDVHWLPYLWNRTDAVLALREKTVLNQDPLKKDPGAAAAQVVSKLAESLGL